MIIARRFEPRCGSPSAGAVRSACSTVSSRARAALARLATRGSPASSATTTEAPASRMTYSSSGGWMRSRKGHGDATGPPDAALHRRIREARRHEEGDARLTQIVVVAEQRAGDARRRVIEILIRERAVGGNDGGAGRSHGAVNRPGADSLRRWTIMTSSMPLIEPGQESPRLHAEGSGRPVTSPLGLCGPSGDPLLLSQGRHAGLHQGNVRVPGQVAGAGRRARPSSLA